LLLKRTFGQVLDLSLPSPAAEMLLDSAQAGELEEALRVEKLGFVSLEIQSKGKFEAETRRSPDATDEASLSPARPLDRPLRWVEADNDKADLFVVSQRLGDSMSEVRRRFDEHSRKSGKLEYEAALAALLDLRLDEEGAMAALRGVKGPMGLGDFVGRFARAAGLDLQTPDTPESVWVELRGGRWRQLEAQDAENVSKWYRRFAPVLDAREGASLDPRLDARALCDALQAVGSRASEAQVASYTAERIAMGALDSALPTLGLGEFARALVWLGGPSPVPAPPAPNPRLGRLSAETSGSLSPRGQMAARGGLIGRGQAEDARAQDSLRGDFKKLDLAGDGRITELALRAVQESSDQVNERPNGEAQARRRWLRDLDREGKGFVDLHDMQEYKAASGDPKGWRPPARRDEPQANPQANPHEFAAAREAAIQMAFDAYDLNGDGVITFLELRTVMARSNRQISEFELREWIKARDRSNRGAVTFSDFRAAYLARAPR